MPEKKTTRVVFACSDHREFYRDAVRHAKAKFPKDHICLRADFGSIIEIAHYPGNLRDHPAIKFMVKNNITEASAYNHEQCIMYRELVEGMNARQELDYHAGDLRLFVNRVRNEAIPSFQADLNYQKLDETKEHVSRTHNIEEELSADAAA